MTPFKYTFIALVASSVVPLLGLKIYISVSGNIEARWLFIKFLPLQLFVWICLGICLLYGIILLIKKGS